jgi:hypothetical protein
MSLKARDQHRATHTAFPRTSIFLEPEIQGHRNVTIGILNGSWNYD